MVTRLLFAFRDVDMTIHLSLCEVVLTTTQRFIIDALPFPESMTKVGNSIARLVEERFKRQDLCTSQDPEFSHVFENETKKANYVVHTSWSVDEEQERLDAIKKYFHGQTTEAAVFWEKTTLEDVIEAFEPDETDATFVVYASQDDEPFHKTVYTDIVDLDCDLECFHCGGCEIKVYHRVNGERILLTEEQIKAIIEEQSS